MVTAEYVAVCEMVNAEYAAIRDGSAPSTSPSATGQRPARRHLRRVTTQNIAICDGSPDYHHSLSSLDSIERRWSREQRSQK